MNEVPAVEPGAHRPSRSGRARPSSSRPRRRSRSRPPSAAGRRYRGAAAGRARSSNVSVKASAPRASRNPRRPASIRAASRERLAPLTAAPRAPGRARRRPRTRPPARRRSRRRRLALPRDELADAVAVRRETPKPELRLDLVALGDRDLAHVVAEPRRPKATAPRASRRRRASTSPIRSTTCGSRQWPTTVLRASPMRVSMNAELAVAVRRLVAGS